MPINNLWPRFMILATKSLNNRKVWEFGRNSLLALSFWKFKNEFRLHLYKDYWIITLIINNLFFIFYQIQPNCSHTFHLFSGRSVKFSLLQFKEDRRNIPVANLHVTVRSFVMNLHMVFHSYSLLELSIWKLNRFCTD